MANPVLVAAYYSVLGANGSGNDPKLKDKNIALDCRGESEDTIVQFPQAPCRLSAR